jgi:hypothetical protein
VIESEYSHGECTRSCKGNVPGDDDVLVAVVVAAVMKQDSWHETVERKMRQMASRRLPCRSVSYVHGP